MMGDLLHLASPQELISGLTSLARTWEGTPWALHMFPPGCGWEEGRSQPYDPEEFERQLLEEGGTAIFNRLLRPRNSWCGAVEIGVNVCVADNPWPGGQSLRQIPPEVRHWPVNQCGSVVYNVHDPEISQELALELLQTMGRHLPKLIGGDFGGRERFFPRGVLEPIQPLFRVEPPSTSWPGLMLRHFALPRSFLAEHRVALPSPLPEWMRWVGEALWFSPWTLPFDPIRPGQWERLRWCYENLPGFGCTMPPADAERWKTRRMDQTGIAQLLGKRVVAAQVQRYWVDGVLQEDGWGPICLSFDDGTQIRIRRHPGDLDLTAGPLREPQAEWTCIRGKHHRTEMAELPFPTGPLSDVQVAIETRSFGGSTWDGLLSLALLFGDEVLALPEGGYRSPHPLQTHRDTALNWRSLARSGEP